MGIRLPDRATVLTPHATTGEYTVVAATDVPCALSTVNVRPGASGPDRAEPAPDRYLYLGPDDTVPEAAQVAIEGDVDAAGNQRRWNVAGGRVDDYRAGGRVHHRRAALVEAR